MPELLELPRLRFAGGELPLCVCSAAVWLQRWLLKLWRRQQLWLRFAIGRAVYGAEQCLDEWTNGSPSDDADVKRPIVATIGRLELARFA